MKTIVHCIDNLGIGGAQSMLFELYYAINKYHSSEFNQLVISMDEIPPNIEFISSYNVPYIAIKGNDHIVKKVLSLKNPIVFYHKLAASKCQLTRMIKKKKVPVIVINNTLFAYTLWRKANHKDCDVMVAVSHHMKKLLKKWFPRIPRYACVHNGVNKNRYDAIKREKKDKDILATGRVNRLCGWKFSARWNKWVQDVKLPLRMTHDYVGGRMINVKGRRGKIHREKTTISKGKYNEIRMLGWINKFEDKVSLMKKWDLFLYETNRPEGISMSILESLACGVPVICSNHYGNIEIIENGINGYVYKSLDEAKKILKDLCRDKKKLDRLRKSTAKHFEEHLDAKYTATEYVKLAKGLT